MMRGKLAVRINDGHADRHVTRYVKGLRFTKTAPGGHHSASMRILLPRGAFRDLGPADRAYIYDTRTGATAWEGYTENPGSADGSGGESFDLSAMGGMILASDESRRLVYVDGDLSAWLRQSNSAAQSTSEVTSDDKLRVAFPPGYPVGTGYFASFAYPGLYGTGQRIGYVTFEWVGGKIDAGYNVRSGSAQNTTDPNQEVGTYTLGYDATLDTAPTAVTFFPPSTDDRVNVTLRRAGGATNVTGETTYADFGKLKVYSALVDMKGNPVGAGATTPARTSDVVVRDLFYRLLANVCDADTSTVEAATYVLDQLAYPDGARASQVFEDLTLYEPDFLWEVLESNAGGKHRFSFRAWPTEPRYEVSVKDGYSAPGGEVDLCNRIAVFWTDPKGKNRTTIVTTSVEALGGDPATPGFTGRIRDAEPITLPEGLGSEANAQRIGQQVLAMKASPPNAARAVVRRPILDRLTGNIVMPWEIEPGYLTRVRETGDQLRLTEMTYTDDDCAAEITLGDPVRSMDQLLAGLRRR